MDFMDTEITPTFAFLKDVIALSPDMDFLAAGTFLTI